MNHEIKIGELASEVVSRSKKAFRNSMIVSLVALLLGAAWLVYSFAQVTTLQNKKSELQAEVDNFSRLIEEKNEELKKVNKEVEEAKILKENLPTDLVNQSLKADEKIKANSPKDPKKLSEYTVLYYEKVTDEGKVKKTLKELGFEIKTTAPKRSDLPSNLIRVGRQVDLEDAKLVAFTLIRAGVEIKEICKLPDPSKSSYVEILGALRLLDSPALTVDQISKKTVFPVCPL